MAVYVCKFKSFPEFIATFDVKNLHKRFGDNYLNELTIIIIFVSYTKVEV